MTMANLHFGNISKCIGHNRPDYMHNEKHIDCQFGHTNIRREKRLLWTAWQSMR
jgi:hypothetical protein